MARFSLALFGPPRVLRDDGTAVTFRLRKELAVLAYLAAEGPAAQPRDTLLGLLWPEAPEHVARNNLRVVLATLRQTLGPDAISADRQMVRLSLGDEAVDVAAFARLLADSRAHRHPPDHRCDACATRLERAAELYRGEFLAGFTLPDAAPFEEWALLRREALHQQMLEALAALAARAESGGDSAALCRHARRQLDLEAWHEPAHRQLMRGLALSGDRGGALAQYERCCQVLADELGIEPEVETRALYEQIRAGQLHPVARAAAAPRHNLPAPHTPLVGREAELGALRALRGQADARLITLVGAGGMGKTRLAIELARASLDAYADGVWFVALAPLATAATLPAAIAQALDLTIHGDPAAALPRLLRDRRMLLVLDNFEHLRDGAALVADLLDAAPGVQLVVTSRERLLLRGEHVLVVEGLDATPSGAAADVAPAVQLFAQSARRARADFQLGEHNLAAVLRICQLVQGMPLGLELAAAWVQLLSLDEIAAEIAGSAGFLAADWRDIPERQRSMRAVFEWSWRLLSDAERQLYRRLAVFRGGFTREAAEAVVGASLALLAGLVHKSLLRRNDAGQGQRARYEVHELLRQFAAQQLASLPGEQAAVEERHSAFFLRFLGQRERRLARQEPRQAAGEIRAEIDNIRQAWGWAARERRLEELDQSAGGLWQFVFLTGLASEGERMFELASDALAEAGGDPGGADRRLLSKLLALYASALITRGRYDQAAAAAEQAVELGRASTGAEGQAIGLFVWGQALYWTGRRPEARERMRQALDLIEYAAGAPSEAIGFVEWHAHVWLRGIYLSLGEYDAARDHGARALRICQALGSSFGEVHSLCNLADVAREMRDLPAARQSYERALQLIPAVGYRWGEAVVQFELGDVLRLQGNYGLALELIGRGLAVAREIGDSLEEARAASILGRLYALLGDGEQARALLALMVRLVGTLETPELEAEAMLLRTTLARQAGDREGALDYAEQTCRLAREFSSRYFQAHALVLLGHTQAEAQRPTAAASYREAIERYESLGDRRLTCEPRAGLAALALADGDIGLALALVEPILRAIDANPRVGLDEPCFVYMVCCRALERTGDPRAPALRQAARRLLDDDAQTIGDAALRRSFLARVAPPT